MRYHNITKEDMLNGDGLRVVLWTAGCSHGCKGCHNTITWDANGGLAFDETAKKELFEELDKSYISGITFSGGDPLHNNNRDQIKELAEEIKQKYKTKTIWLYTGYRWEDIAEWDIVKSLDVVVDGRFELEKRDVQLHWKGSSNQRVIDVQKSLQTNGVVLHA